MAMTLSLPLGPELGKAPSLTILGQRWECPHFGWVLGLYPRPRLHFQTLYLQLHSPAQSLQTNRRHLLSSPVNSFRPGAVSAVQLVCRAWAWEFLLLVFFVLSPWSPGIWPHRSAPRLGVSGLWHMNPLRLFLGAAALGSV